MKSENINLDGMNQQEFHMPPLEVRKKVRRNGSKRRLVLLIILLICTLSLLGSATYAWFTANKTVRIEDLQINVSVANGLEISSDAKTWNQVITLNDLRAASGLPQIGIASDSEDAGAINYFPEELHNVSSIGNIGRYNATTAADNNNRLELFTGTASTVCDVAIDKITPGFDPTNPPDDWDIDDPSTWTKTVGVTSEYYKPASGDQYNLEDCIIGEYFYDRNGDGEIDKNEFQADGVTQNEDYEGDETQHGVQTGLVESHKYTSDNQKACQGKGETGSLCNTDVSIIAFDVYLKLDEASNIKLAQGSSVTNIGTDDPGLKNTMRIAFVTLGTQPYEYYYAEDDDIENGKLKANVADTETSDANGATADSKANAAYVDVFGGYTGKYGARTMNAFGSITIWEPNAKQHTTAGVLNATTNYDGVSESDVKGKAVTTNGIYDDLELAAPQRIPLSLKNADKDSLPTYFAPQKLVTDYAAENTTFKTAHPTVAANAPYKNNINYFQTDGGELKEDANGARFLFAAPKGVTKLRVYLWVEGNDYDTENNATDGHVNVQLLFTSSMLDSETLQAYETYDKTSSKSGTSYVFRNSPDLGANVNKNSSEA